MDFFLDSVPRRRLAAAIYTQLRDAITAGNLATGQLLAPSRNLADTLGVSRHTVTTAYGRLVAEGFLEGAAGGGTRVAGVWSTGPRPAGPANTPSPSLEATPTRFDLRIGRPDPSLFPTDDWRRALARAWRLGGSTPIGGEQHVRAVVAAWAYRSRSIRATDQQVFVTAGAQHAFDIALTAYLRPGDVVVVEQPGYDRFAELARRRGATIVGVPVDEQGLITDLLPHTAALVHVTPSHQFPVGGALSLPRRRALLAWAQRVGAFVIEDDYDSEFRFGTRPLEPLHLLDTDDRVFYVATFSKTLSPTLRLGYLVAPRSCVEQVTASADVLARQPDDATMHALASLVLDGQLTRHLNAARRAYARRHQALAAAVDSRLANVATRVPSSAGLHLSVRLQLHVDDDLAGRAHAAGLALTSPVATGAGPETVTYLPLGYGLVAEADVEEAVEVLATVLGGG